MLEILVAFVLGLVAGLVTKGVNINIVHKPVDNSEVKYNESMAGYLPKEVQHYYMETDGQNKF